MTSNQIKFAEHGENVRHNVVSEDETRRSNVTREQETQRHNVETEQLGWSNLAEMGRHNLSQEDIGYENVRVSDRMADAAMSQAGAAWYNAGTNRRNADTNWYNAQTNRIVGDSSVLLNQFRGENYQAGTRLTNKNTSLRDQENVRSWIQVGSSGIEDITKSIRNIGDLFKPFNLNLGGTGLTKGASK